MMGSKQRPTSHAPDAGDSAHISSSFLASSFFCSQAESTPAPAPQPVGQVRDPARLRLGDDDANRWVAKCSIDDGNK
jgi:hypothetical protein